jgi:hypothetical protein
VSDEIGSEQPPARTKRQEALGHHSRSERRSARRAARRRKAMTRLSYVAGPVVVLILVVVAFLTFLGWPDNTKPTESTGSTLAANPADGSGLLVIEQGDVASVVVLLHPRGEGGAVLGMPGMTLIKTAGAEFKTLSDLHRSGQDEALGSALAEALGVRTGAIASVQWSALRDAMTQAGVDDLPPVELTLRDVNTDEVARGVMALAGAGNSANGAAIWERLALAGDASGFRGAVKVAAPLISTGAWTGVALPGRVVEGAEFEYLEPDVELAKTLLAGTAQRPTVTVEVQNGSGVLGVAQQAGELLEPQGYKLLPFRNSDGFPDVKRTLITVSPGAVAEGERVRTLLGVGTVVQDDALDSGQIVVVVGKDFSPPASAGTEPAS